MRSDTPAPAPRPPRRFRAVALVALTSLACTTVRVPVSAIPSTVPVRGEIAEPQVELWVESGGNVSPAEAGRAAADARAALGVALASRRLADGDQLLVVREQGVSRTGSRRADQQAAVAGLVVGAVAIVAVAVVVLVASKGDAARAAKAPARHVAAPRPAPPPAAVRPARVPPVAPVPPPPVVAIPAPHGGPTIAIGADVNVVVPAGPQAGPPPATWIEAAVAGPPPLAAPPPPEPITREVVLPPVPALDISRRGFFAGDSTRLELTLVDRATGAPLWVKTIASADDPRDARAVGALLGRALDDRSGWAPAATTP